MIVSPFSHHCLHSRKRSLSALPEGSLRSSARQSLGAFPLCDCGSHFPRPSLHTGESCWGWGLTRRIWGNTVEPSSCFHPLLEGDCLLSVFRGLGWGREESHCPGRLDSLRAPLLPSQGRACPILGGGGGPFLLPGEAGTVSAFPASAVSSPGCPSPLLPEAADRCPSLWVWGVSYHLYLPCDRGVYNGLLKIESDNLLLLLF